MTAESSSPALAGPRIAPTRLFLHGLSTGGQWGPLSGLSTVLGRPPARLGRALRARSAVWTLRRGATKTTL